MPRFIYSLLSNTIWLLLPRRELMEKGTTAWCKASKSGTEHSERKLVLSCVRNLFRSEQFPKSTIAVLGIMPGSESNHGQTTELSCHRLL